MAAVDRLSALPDEILHNILSFLTIDDSVRTSSLSSRWRRVCSTNPTLNFSFSNRFAGRNIISLVDQYLILTSSTRKLISVRFPHLFSVNIHPKIAVALSRWLRFAADRGVEEVVISRLLIDSCVEIPWVLFECGSLCSLKLRYCFIRSVPIRSEEERLKLLKTVVLASVDVGDNALTSLLSICPVIETLALTLCRNLSQIVVSSPTLRSLTIRNCDDLNRFEVTCAPQLRRLMYEGDILKVTSMEGMKNLEEADIISTRKPFANYQLWKQFITALAHVKVLSGNSWFFEFPLKAEVIFHNLKEFHWWPECKSVCLAENWTGCDIKELMPALQYCPVLELLCMHGDRLDDELFEPEDVPNIFGKLDEAKGLLPCLKKLKMVNISCGHEDLQLIKFVLSKAAQLESVLLWYQTFYGEEKERLAEMLMVMGSLPKASRRARVSLSGRPCDACPKHYDMWWQFADF